MADNMDLVYSDAKQILQEALADEAATFTKDYFSDLKSRLSSYNSQLKNVIADVNGETMSSLQMASLINKDEHLSIQYKRYMISKQMAKTQPELKQLLRDGYLIIDNLREAFTGEEIKYFVGVSVGRAKKLYTGYLPLKSILNMTKLEAVYKNTSSDMFKLRLNAKKSELKAILEPVPENSPHSSIWTSIINYASANKTNQGNLFEAYRKMVAIYSENRIPPAKWTSDIFDEQFENVLSAVRKNTTSFVKGGDYLDESVKFFGGSNPSLASISTIKNTIDQVIEALDSTSAVELNKALTNIFEKTKLVEDGAITLEVATEDMVDGLLAPFDST